MISQFCSMIKFQNDPGGFDMVRNSWRMQLDTNERLWHRGDFRAAGASSLRFPVMALHLLHDTTIECHASPSRTGGSSPRLLYRGEKFTPVRNLTQRYHVNVKRPRVSVWHWPIDWNKKRMRNVCNFESRLYFYQHEVYLQIARYEMTQSSCKRDTK